MPYMHAEADSIGTASFSELSFFNRIADRVEIMLLTPLSIEICLTGCSEEISLSAFDNFSIWHLL